jgi:hypothetical protein
MLSKKINKLVVIFCNYFDVVSIYRYAPASPGLPLTLGTPLEPGNPSGPDMLNFIKLKMLKTNF